MAKPSKKTTESVAVANTAETTTTEKVVAIKPRIHHVAPYQDEDTSVYISKAAHSVLCQAEEIRSSMAENGERIFSANPALTAVDVFVVDPDHTKKWEQPIASTHIGVKVNKPSPDLEEITHNKDIYQRFLID